MYAGTSWCAAPATPSPPSPSIVPDRVSSHPDEQLPAYQAPTVKVQDARHQRLACRPYCSCSKPRVSGDPAVCRAATDGAPGDVAGPFFRGVCLSRLRNDWLVNVRQVAVVDVHAASPPLILLPVVPRWNAPDALHALLLQDPTVAHLLLQGEKVLLVKVHPSFAAWNVHLSLGISHREHCAGG